MFKTFQHLRWIIVGLTAVVLFHITIENTAAKKWEIVSQLPTGRSAFSTAVVEGKIYVIGGLEGAAFDQHVKTLESYHPKAGMWRVRKPMPIT